MAIAAVLFALPFAVASTLWLFTLNGLGLSEAAIVYVVAGLGAMLSFMVAAGVAGFIART